MFRWKMIRLLDQIKARHTHLHLHTHTYTHTHNLLAHFFLQEWTVHPKCEIKEEIDIKEEFLEDEEEYMENEQPLVLDDDDQVISLFFFSYQFLSSLISAFSIPLKGAQLIPCSLLTISDHIINALYFLLRGKVMNKIFHLQVTFYSAKSWVVSLLSLLMQLYNTHQ